MNMLIVKVIQRVGIKVSYQEDEFRKKKVMKVEIRLSDVYKNNVSYIE